MEIENEYAEQFFEKKMRPGRMGEGFVYIGESMMRAKPLKPFASFDDLTRRK
jgi:hypothetical protein